MRPAPRHERLILAGLCLFSFVASYLIYRTLFPLFSADLDEGVYVFHSRMFRAGMLTLPSESHGDFFRPWLSGETDGQIFTQLQPGMPGFLALGSLLGSYRVAVALLAPVTVVAVRGLTLELFGHRWTAMGAAALIAFSPILLVHGAVVLTYLLTTAAVTGASWAWLAAVRRQSWPLGIVAGAVAGVALVTRPLDAALFVAPFGILGLVRLRRNAGHWGSARPLLLGAAAGALPFVVGLLLYTAAVTGSPFRFPNTAADPLNNFGFGVRRLLPTEPTIDYDVVDAFRALRDNVRAIPGWIVGGPVALALAVVAVLSSRGRRPEILATLIAGLAFPVAYFFWWATKLSACCADNWLGPHYYVPAYVALAILVAFGVSRIRWTKTIAAITVVVGLAFTAYAIPDKVSTNRAFKDDYARVDALLPDDLTAAVVLMDTDGKPYILSRWPFLVTDPELGGDVVFAAEYSPEASLLPARFPDRDFYRLRLEMRPGDTDIFRPSGGFTSLDVTRGERIEFTVTIDRDHPVLRDRTVQTLYVRVGDTEIVNEPPDGPRTFTVGHGDDPEADITVDEATEIVVGITIETPSGDATERAEQRIGVAIDDDDRLIVLTPGAGYFEFAFPDGATWLPYDVSEFVVVDARAA